MSCKKFTKGFTLIELMITVAIVAILAAIALPNYTAYIQRGKITDATSTLAQQYVVMERYYQDNRNYGSTATTCGPTKPADNNFTYDCKWRTANSTQTFILTATGNPAKGMPNTFVYTIDDTNTKQTTGFPGDPGIPKSCWISKKGESC